MKVLTEMTYESLAQALGLAPGMVIDLVEVDNIKGSISFVVSGDLPPGTTNLNGGFYPSVKWRGHSPDKVHPNHLFNKKSRRE